MQALPSEMITIITQFLPTLHSFGVFTRICKRHNEIGKKLTKEAKKKYLVTVKNKTTRFIKGHSSKELEKYSQLRRNDKKHGDYKKYINGKLVKHCSFKNGKIHGEYEAWQKGVRLDRHNGGWKETSFIVYIHCYYKDGKKHGKYEEWRDGNLAVQSYYENGWCTKTLD